MGTWMDPVKFHLRSHPGYVKCRRTVELCVRVLELLSPYNNLFGSPNQCKTYAVSQEPNAEEALAIWSYVCPIIGQW
jgi:hypothetical protein